MSDLISRSALLEDIKAEIKCMEKEKQEYFNQGNFHNGNIIVEKIQSVRIAMKIIGNHPTVEAIPKEKLDEIVEQLKNISVMIYGEFNVLGLERAIEIVKEVGGVCEQKTQ